jgi:hypothetical protein
MYLARGHNPIINMGRMLRKDFRYSYSEDVYIHTPLKYIFFTAWQENMVTVSTHFEEMKNIYSTQTRWIKL